MRFGLLPQRLHLCERSAGQSGMAFDESEALTEFRVGLPQRLLGIHFEFSRKVHQDEQQIADLTFELLRGAAFARLRQFAQLFVQLVEHLAGIFPIEPNASRLWS